jgi:putative ABC transport system permease protein
MKHFFSSIFRKAVKYKTYTIINIAGLSIAFALSSLLLLYAYNEYHVDGFHRNSNRIYRVVNSNDGCAFTDPLLARETEDGFPEIEATCRVRHIDGGYYKYQDQVFDVTYNMCFDSTAFRMFDFKLVAGDVKKALIDPFSIVLTENTAHKIFGDADPMGKTLDYNSICKFTVTGVIKNLPSNSTFNVDAILPFHVIEYIWEGDPKKLSNVLKERGNESFHTYIMFQKNVNVKKIENKITSFIKEKGFGQSFVLQPMPNIYFDKNDRDRWVNKGDTSTVKLLFSIALGLLLISIINYINLNSAITRNNFFSLGIRKLLGADSKQIIISSFTETVLFFVVSIAIASLLVLIIREPFQNILSSDYHFASVLTLKNIALFAGVIFIVAFLSGIVPAYYFNRFPSATIIQKKHAGYSSSNLLNKTLIVLQFFITIIFIVAALSIEKQVNYINHKNLGFEKDLLLYVDLKSLNMNQSQSEVMKTEFLADPGIQSVSFSAGLFGDVRRGNNSMVNGVLKHFRRIPTDPDYVKTMGYHIAQGRDFSWEMKTDFTSQAYIINQAMAKAFEMDDPLKEQIDGHPIVGVIEDFNFESIHKSIQPVALVCDPTESVWAANVRLSSANIPGSLKHIEKVFKKLRPDTPLHCTFADARIASYYEKDIRFSKLSVIFSFINIILSCVGLVGLVLFTVNRRIKEIGIRKVNGANVSEVMAMLNQNFIKWICTAFILAAPVSYYAMHKWLENFAYKTELSWWIFAIAGLLALGIALLTVSWQSWKAATRNPVEALRYE